MISTARRPGETRRAVQIARGRTFLLQPRLAGVVIDLHLSTLRVLRLHRTRAPVMGAQDNRRLSRRASPGCGGFDVPRALEGAFADAFG